MSSNWLDEKVCRVCWPVVLDFLSICNRQSNGLSCERRRGSRHEWLWEIVEYYVLVTELSWCRKSTGRDVVFPRVGSGAFCSSASEGRKCVEAGSG
jgi:hypothetical protein